MNRRGFLGAMTASAAGLLLLPVSELVYDPDAVVATADMFGLSAMTAHVAKVLHQAHPGLTELPRSDRWSTQLVAEMVFAPQQVVNVRDLDEVAHRFASKMQRHHLARLGYQGSPESAYEACRVGGVRGIRQYDSASHGWLTRFDILAA